MYRVLSFTDWNMRLITCPSLSNEFCLSTQHHHFFWKLMAFQLRDEAGLYLPSSFTPAKPERWQSWRGVFMSLWRTRGLWDSAVPGPSTRDELQLFVAARFRPLSHRFSTFCTDATEHGKHAMLPLHQQVQLMKLKHNISAQEALRRLSSRTKQCPGDPWANGLVLEHRSHQDQEPHPSENSTTPHPEQAEQEQSEEDDDGAESLISSGCLVTPQPSQNCVVTRSAGVGFRNYHFNAVFKDSASQPEVFREAAQPLVVDFINGMNASFVCYGQTGSGKTHTMFGSEGQPGVVHMACEEVITAIEQRRERGLVDSRLEISFVEIFGEHVSDLLANGHAVTTHMVLEGTRAVPLVTAQDLRAALAEGDARKRQSATLMNDRSSRAHSLVILRLTQQRFGSEEEVVSDFIFADLGGSEQIKKSKVTGEQVQEAININLGLLALKKCIEALRRKHRHVPFKESKLTTLLSPALGGDSKTTVVVTCAAEDHFAPETIQTLRFGVACGNVTNRLARQQDAALEAAVAFINEEIVSLQQVITKKERWLTHRETFIDGHGEVQIKSTSRMTGAEEEHARVEDLVRRRGELLGSALSAALA